MSTPRKWTLADSAETYQIRAWGSPFFGINEKGHVVVHPDGPEGPQADLKELVDEVRRRGIGLPLLLRFSDILQKRVIALNESFRRAITEYGYKAEYRGVYPIKVNQVATVVDTVLKAGRPYHYGLEAGSKPELLAVMALLEDPDALIVCNGYKDEEYVETALHATSLGRTVLMVVEKPSELTLITTVARRMGVRPHIGIRVRLSTRGSGRWEASGGDRSKFGLSAAELLEGIAQLKESGYLDCFELLHFHLGSQISNIRSFKQALREAGRFYVELRLAGAPLRFLDVGGGLGVDYDGSQTNFESSMNYTMQEYANDIVYGLKEMCDAAEVPHPNIVSESGRAIVAHHAVLLMDVLGAGEFQAKTVPETVPADASPVVKNLLATFKEVTRKNLLEAYHDALDFKEQCLQLFTLGHLPLEQRVLAENIYWALVHKIARLAKENGEMPEELERLEKNLADTYFCNFSVFQSLPDSWAIDHLFPIMPIHRLEEEPSRRAVLADITCDSDGKIDHFIDRRDVKDMLELHPLRGDDYVLGIFLVGAYQEILGDLHNLFGDTNDVVVSVGPQGYQIENVYPGDTVTEVLKYVSYSREDLVARLRRSAEQSLRAGKISLEQSRAILRAFEEGLAGYTYLERGD